MTSTAITPHSKITELLKEADIQVKLTQNDLIDFLVEQRKEELNAQITEIYEAFRVKHAAYNEKLNSLVAKKEALCDVVRKPFVKRAKAFAQTKDVKVSTQQHSDAGFFVYVSWNSVDGPRPSNNYSCVFSPVFPHSTEYLSVRAEWLALTEKHSWGSRDACWGQEHGTDQRAAPMAVDYNDPDYKVLTDLTAQLSRLNQPSSLRTFRKRFVEEVLAQTVEGRQLLDKLVATARGMKKSSK